MTATEDGVDVSSVAATKESSELVMAPTPPEKEVTFSTRSKLRNGGLSEQDAARDPPKGSECDEDLRHLAAGIKTHAAKVGGGKVHRALL